MNDVIELNKTKVIHTNIIVNFLLGVNAKGTMQLQYAVLMLSYKL